MKKSLVSTLALAISLSTSAVVMAAPADNPFNDVPAKHWAYDSLNKLVEAGIVDGYQGRFNGGQTLTRYEMAQIVAKAMGKAEKADAQTKLAIEKLSKEFATELDNNFLIRANEERIQELEEKTDNVKMRRSYVRWAWEKDKIKNNGKTVSNTNNDSYFRMNLGFEGQVNDNWKWTLWMRQNTDAYASGQSAESKDMLNRAFVSGWIDDAKVSVGRQYHLALDGTLWESYFDGVKVELDETVKTTLYFGYYKTDTQVAFYDNKNKSLGNYIMTKSKAADSTAYKNASRTAFYGIETETDLTDSTNLRGAYYVLTGSDLPETLNGSPVSTQKNKSWQLMLTQDLGNDFEFIGTYVQNDAKMDNKAHGLKLAYKDTHKKQPGSYRLEAQYRLVDRFVPVSGVYDIDVIKCKDDNTYKHNSKIWEFNFDYVPWKNTKWATTFSFAKSTDGTNLKENNISSQMNFYF